VNGNKLTGNPVPFIIEDSVNVVISAYKGPKGRVYENVRIYMLSACEWDLYNDVETGTPAFIHDYVEVSMSFLPPCPIPEWHSSFTPLPPVTSEDNSVRLVAYFPGYDSEENELTEVEFIYLRGGDFTWMTAEVLTENVVDTTSSSSLADWVVSPNLYDGVYEMKVSATCTYSSSVSASIPLLIDQQPFKFFGTLAPVGTPLRKGETATFAFSKELDCPTVQHTVTSEGNQESQVDHRMICLDNLVKILLSGDAHESLEGANVFFNITVRTVSGTEATTSVILATG